MYLLTSIWENVAMTMTCCEIGHNIHYTMPNQEGGGLGGGVEEEVSGEEILNVPVTSRAAPVM